MDIENERDEWKFQQYHFFCFIIFVSLYKNGLCNCMPELNCIISSVVCDILYSYMCV